LSIGSSRKPSAAGCRSDWQVEDGDLLVLHRGGAGLFAYEHVFAGDEIAQEIAAAGLEVCHRQDLPHQSVAWLSPISQARG
jgi:hypothetical protein